MAALVKSCCGEPEVGELARECLKKNKSAFQKCRGETCLKNCHDQEQYGADSRGKSAKS